MSVTELTIIHGLMWNVLLIQILQCMRYTRSSLCLWSHTSLTMTSTQFLLSPTQESAPCSFGIMWTCFSRHITTSHVSQTSAVIRFFLHLLFDLIGRTNAKKKKRKGGYSPKQCFPTFYTKSCLSAQCNLFRHLIAC